MICFAKPGLTEDLNLEQKEDMLFVQYVHLTKGQAYS
jgi:hypothetical protein